MAGVKFKLVMDGPNLVGTKAVRAKASTFVALSDVNTNRFNEEELNFIVNCRFWTKVVPSKNKG